MKKYRLFLIKSYMNMMFRVHGNKFLTYKECFEISKFALDTYGERYFKRLIKSGEM